VTRNPSPGGAKRTAALDEPLSGLSEPPDAPPDVSQGLAILLDALHFLEPEFAEVYCATEVGIERIALLNSELLRDKCQYRFLSCELADE